MAESGSSRVWDIADGDMVKEIKMTSLGGVESGLLARSEMLASVGSE